MWCEQSVSGGVSAAADLATDAVTGDMHAMDHPKNVAKLVRYCDRCSSLQVPGRSLIHQ